MEHIKIANLLSFSFFSLPCQSRTCFHGNGNRRGDRLSLPHHRRHALPALRLPIREMLFRP